MANKKITDLTNLQTPVANSEFVVVDIQNDETKAITFANLNASIQTSTGVTAGLYGGVLGTETNVAAITVGADGRITSAANITVQVDLATLEGNVNTVSSNVVAVESRRATNTTAFLNEDTALQARITANSTAFQAEDTALQTRLTTNVNAFTSEDTALQARITANNTLLHSNDFITFTRLNANVDIVQDNVAAIIDGTTNFSGEVTMTDDLIVTGNLTVNGDTTTINTTNMDVDDTMIMLANGTTGSPANDIGILFNRGDQGNAAIFYDESAKTFKFSDTKDPKSNTALSPVTASNISVGILDAATVKFNGADLNTAITDNVSTLTTEDTALQARITANNTLITDLETRRTQNIAGGVSTITTSDLTADRAVISSGAGKVAVSTITATEIGHLSGIDQNINSNLTALAAGIAGTVISANAPTGDYGLLDAANSSTDSFGVATAGLTTFDMRAEPAGSLNQQDLGALT